MGMLASSSLTSIWLNSWTNYQVCRPFGVFIILFSKRVLEGRERVKGKSSSLYFLTDMNPEPNVLGHRIRTVQVYFSPIVQFSSVLGGTWTPSESFFLNCQCLKHEKNILTQLLLFLANSMKYGFILRFLIVNLIRSWYGCKRDLEKKRYFFKLCLISLDSFSLKNETQDRPVWHYDGDTNSTAYACFFL